MKSLLNYIKKYKIPIKSSWRGENSLEKFAIPHIYPIFYYTLVDEVAKFVHLHSH